MPSILYIGEASLGSASADRANALERLGASVVRLPVPQFERGLWSQLDRQSARRLQLGTWITRFNSAVVEAGSKHYDIIWLDKPWMLKPRTVQELRQHTSYLVMFNNDNPWGPLERGRWRLLLGAIRHTDLVITPRSANVPDYLAKGARLVRIADFGFAPERQVPPSDEVTNPKLFDVSFIGTATADGAQVRPHRAHFLSDVANRLPGRITIFGDGWSKFARNLKAVKNIGPAQMGDAYNQAIWSSKVSLSFVNWAQADETSHRAFEITACRGLLLAERSPRLETSFRENVEALFFSSVDECVEKLRSALNNERDRLSISEAGHQRSMSSGYDNDSRLRQVILQTNKLRDYFGV